MSSSRKQKEKKMKLWLKVTLVTLLFTIPAFLTGHIIWPPAPGTSPGATLLPFFLLLSFLEALSFGLGMAFLVYGWPFMSTLAGGSKRMTYTMFVIIAWFLISWWPHDNLHLHNGLNLQGLLFIEYGFHVTLMIGGAVLAFCFVRLLRRSRPSRALPEPSSQVQTEV
jgi:hypothetical protein